MIILQEENHRSNLDKPGQRNDVPPDTSNPEADNPENGDSETGDPETSTGPTLPRDSVPPKREPNALLRVVGPTLLVTLLAFVIAYQFVGPPPPDRIVMATGAADGEYARIAAHYQTILAREGITLEVRTTSGSVANLRLLEEDPEVQVALVQSGCGNPESAPSLLGLASVFYEPLWLFHRRGLTIAQLGDLAGRRVATGPEGSGTRSIILELLRDNGLDESSLTLVPIGGTEAADALLQERVDAACFVTASNAPVVAQLASADDLTLFNFTRAEAYTRHHRYLSRLVLPQGVLDIARDYPARDVTLVAPTATLIARDDLHPAISDLLLRAADEVHGGGALLESPGEFPTNRYVDFPLSKEAQRYFESGPPFLQRYLPFWAATLLDRMKVMILPLLTILFPLLKIVPPVYRWRMRNRIYRWYRDLGDVDRALDASTSAKTLDAHMAALDKIEVEAELVSVPLSLTDELYELRVHIELVRQKARAMGATS